MTPEEITALLNLYIDPSYESKESAREYLKETGIDPEALHDEFGELLRKKEAEIKIEKGKELQKEFDEALKNPDENQPGTKNDNYRMAARNFEGMTEEDIKLIRENLDALKKIKQKNKS